jgi:hypothetical protein
MVGKTQYRIALGGEFGLSRVPRGLTTPTRLSFSPETMYFQSGRDAIRALLTIFPQKRIFASSYSCDSVINSLRWENWENLILLDIDSTLYPDLNYLGEKLSLRTGDYSDTLFFLGNLWGTPYPPDLHLFLDSYRNGGGTVIEDITHKIDLRPIDEADGWVCSARKWFGTSGLAALNVYGSSLIDEQLNLRVASSMSMRLVLMQVLNYFPKQTVLRRQIIELLRDSDSKLGYGKLITLASRTEINRFQNQDWQSAFEARLRNKQIYEDRIEQNLTIKIVNPTTLNFGSFPTTIKVASGQLELRAFLRSKNVFAANLWPLGEWGAANPNANKLSTLMLTLPTDQRYDSESCIRIAELVNHYQAKLDKHLLK